MSNWQSEWDDKRKTDEWLRDVAYRERAVVPSVLRCIFHTRLIIPGSKVPSGTRYDAMPRHIISVRDEDRKTLLDMTRKQDGCQGCGGSQYQEEQHYFEEVKEV